MKVNKRIAVIPARGGSRRIPRKNVREFMGKPIIAYSIEVARASGLFGQVVVSTEDEEISEIARRWGADVLERPSALALGSVGTQKVMRHALGVIPVARHACCIYATAPMLTRGDLWRGLRTLILSRADFAYCGGMFYWGKRDSFLKGHSLGNVHVPIDVARYIDINTTADWAEAERMYAVLHGLRAAA